jgi:hypothetical protein
MRQPLIPPSPPSLCNPPPLPPSKKQTNTKKNEKKKTLRDPRGFAVKFYTREGNWDLVGNNMPVFFIRDGMKFPDMVRTFFEIGGVQVAFCALALFSLLARLFFLFRAAEDAQRSRAPLSPLCSRTKTKQKTKRQVHALKPNPKSHIQEGWRIADFFSHHPEALVSASKRERKREGAAATFFLVRSSSLAFCLWRCFLLGHPLRAFFKRRARSHATSRKQTRLRKQHPTVPGRKKNDDEKQTIQTKKKQHMFSFLLDDVGIPLNYRHMEGFGVHTFVLLNAAGKETLVKFHWKPAQGERSFSRRFFSAFFSAFFPGRLCFPASSSLFVVLFVAHCRRFFRSPAPPLPLLPRAPTIATNHRCQTPLQNTTPKNEQKNNNRKTRKKKSTQKKRNRRQEPARGRGGGGRRRQPLARDAGPVRGDRGGRLPRVAAVRADDGPGAAGRLRLW